MIGCCDCCVPLLFSGIVVVGGLAHESNLARVCGGLGEVPLDLRCAEETDAASGTAFLE